MLQKLFYTKKQDNKDSPLTKLSKVNFGKRTYEFAELFSNSINPQIDFGEEYEKFKKSPYKNMDINWKTSAIYPSLITKYLIEKKKLLRDLDHDDVDTIIRIKNEQEKEIASEEKNRKENELQRHKDN